MVIILASFSCTKFFHITDNATCFSKKAVAYSKQEEEIADAFIKHWISTFGAPGVILLNNGGEFNKSLFKHG